MSLVACYRNTTTCQWEYYDKHDELEYDIWLVNGNPNTSGLNSLAYQFSYDRQNTIELYLLFFMCYIILVPLQLYAVRLQKHPVTRLFTASLLLEFIALCLILIHVLKFALDGVGYEQLEVAGDIFDILSRVSFRRQLYFYIDTIYFKCILTRFSICADIVHVTPSAACQRMGCNKNGIDMETIGFCYMAVLRNSPYSFVRVEYGMFFSIFNYSGASYNDLICSAKYNFN